MVRLTEEAKGDFDLPLSQAFEYDAQPCMPTWPQWYWPPLWWQLAAYSSTIPPYDSGFPNKWQTGTQKQRRDKRQWDNADTKTNGTFAGQVWEMARDVDGCRVLQDFLDRATTTNEQRVALAQELVTHVWEAIQCKNANHVLQKFIVTINPDASQFIIDEITEEPHRAWYTVRHCYGCRVVERLFEYCRKSQVQALCDEILYDAVSLCKHQFGNYVAQELFEHGTVEHQQKLAKIVKDHVASMCSDYHAVAVVSQSLSSGKVEDRVSVASSVLKQPGLVVSMARSRHGQEAVKRLLQVPNREVRDNVFRLLTDNVEELQRSRYGRVIAKHLLSLHTQQCASVSQEEKASESAVE